MLGENGAYYPHHTPAPPQSRLTLTEGGGSGGQSVSRSRLTLLGGGAGAKV